MSDCSLSGRGQGHVSNFYIVDLENFATGNRRHAGDIHNSSVVGLFMTPIRQWKRLDRVMFECTCLLHIGPAVTRQLYNFHLFRTYRTSSLCTVASRGSSVIAELLVGLRTAVADSQTQLLQVSNTHTRTRLTALFPRLPR